MLWVLKRNVSMTRLFCVPKRYAKTDGLENIYNLMFENFVYKNLKKSALPFARMVHAF